MIEKKEKYFKLSNIKSHDTPSNHKLVFQLLHINIHCSNKFIILKLNNNIKKNIDFNKKINTSL